jgi:hypothetical protein
MADDAGEDDRVGRPWGLDGLAILAADHGLADGPVSA